MTFGETSKNIATAVTAALKCLKTRGNRTSTPVQRACIIEDKKESQTF